MNQSENDTVTDDGAGPSPERREFLTKAGKLALTAPPAMAILMSTTNRAFAHAGSYTGKPLKKPRKPRKPRKK